MNSDSYGVNLERRKKEVVENYPPTLLGLARVLDAMRWEDLECFAHQLDAYRRQDSEGIEQIKSAKSLKALHMSLFVVWQEDEALSQEEGE